MATQQAPAPDEVLRREPPEPLRHYLCQCQHGKQPSYSRCGVTLGGKPESSAAYKPMEICGMCTLMRESQTPCAHCGRPAT